ncbi:MAG: hypothetical protein HKN19_05235 [Halioglobus sp.]|nr:hypothetical protein [Halioglobus sp.]
MRKPLHYLCAFILVSITGQALAEDAPYVLEGLHTNLTMRDALARAEALGGTCVSIRPRRKIGGVSSQCTFPACDLEKENEACPAELLQAATFKIGGQPIHTLVMEAPAEDERLRNISLFYEGEVYVLLDRFLELFGEPKFDTAPKVETSWTRSRRLMWQRGVQRISFMTRPQTIIIAADRPEYGNKM